jgi:hypothetical protein
VNDWGALKTKLRLGWCREVSSCTVKLYIHYTVEQFISTGIVDEAEAHKYDFSTQYQLVKAAYPNFTIVVQVVINVVHS